MKTPLPTTGAPTSGSTPTTATAATAATAAAPASANGTEQPPAARSARRLRLLTLVLAVACGASVANLYYAQPLLGLLARSFGTSQGLTATVVTATQLGYAVGLVLLMPLGDLLENRRLAVVTLGFTALALLGAAAAPGLVVLAVMAVLVGVTSVVAQVLVPLAAHLAPEERRGAVVGS